MYLYAQKYSDLGYKTWRASVSAQFIFLNPKSTWKCGHLDQPHISPLHTNSHPKMGNAKRCMNVIHGNVFLYSETWHQERGRQIT